MHLSPNTTPDFCLSALRQSTVAQEVVDACAKGDMESACDTLRTALNKVLPERHCSGDYFLLKEKADDQAAQLFDIRTIVNHIVSQRAN